MSDHIILDTCYLRRMERLDPGKFLIVNLLIKTGIPRQLKQPDLNLPFH